MRRLDKLEAILAERKEALEMARWHLESCGHNPPLWKYEQLQRDVERAELALTWFEADYREEYAFLKGFEVLAEIPVIDMITSSVDESLAALERIREGVSA